MKTYSKKITHIVMPVFLVALSLVILILTFGIPADTQPKGNFTSSAIVDFDEDGLKNIVTVDNEDQKLCIFDHDLNLVGEKSLPANMVYSPPAVADIDDDGYKEVAVLGLKNYQIDTGNEQKNIPGKLSCFIFNCMQEQFEAISVENGLTIEIDNIYPIIREQEINPPVLVDIDDDGAIEILFGFSALLDMGKINNQSQLSDQSYKAAIFSYEINGEVTHGFPFFTQEKQSDTLEEGVAGISNLAFLQLEESDPVKYPLLDSIGMDGLVGCWHFEAQVLDDLGHDSSLYGNRVDNIDGVQGAGNTPGKIGKGANFSNKSGYFEESPHFTLCKEAQNNFIKEDFTISTWIKLDGSSPKYRPLFARVNCDIDDDSANLEESLIDFALLLNTENKLCVFNGEEVTSIDTAVPEDNEWHHIALVRELTSAGNNGKLFSVQTYIDGNLDSEWTEKEFNGMEEAKFYVGCISLEPLLPTTDDNYSYGLDEIYVFNRGLNYGEIEDIYNLQKDYDYSKDQSCLSSTNKGIAFTVGGKVLYLITQNDKGLYGNVDTGFPLEDIGTISGPLAYCQEDYDKLAFVEYSTSAKPSIRIINPGVYYQVWSLMSEQVDLSDVKEVEQPPPPIMGLDGKIVTVIKYRTQDNKNKLCISAWAPYPPDQEQKNSIIPSENLPDNDFVLNQPALYVPNKETEEILLVEGIAFNLSDSSISLVSLEEEFEGDQTTWAVADLETNSTKEIVKTSGVSIQIEKKSLNVPKELTNLLMWLEWHSDIRENPWPTLASGNNRDSRYCKTKDHGAIAISEHSWGNPLTINEGEKLTYNIKVFDINPYDIVLAYSTCTADYYYLHNDGSSVFKKSQEGKFEFNPVGQIMSMSTGEGDSGLYRFSSFIDDSNGDGDLFYLYAKVKGKPHDPSIEVWYPGFDGITTYKNVPIYWDIYGVGPFEVQIYDDKNTSSWQKYENQPYSWTLSGDDGEKIIHGIFKDTYGQVETSTTVELDAKQPEIKIEPVEGPLNATERIVKGTVMNGNNPEINVEAYKGNPTINSISQAGNAFTIKITLEAIEVESAIEITAKDPKWPADKEKVYFTYQEEEVPPPTPDLIVKDAKFISARGGAYYLKATIANIGNGIMPAGVPIPVIAKFYEPKMYSFTFFGKKYVFHFFHLFKTSYNSVSNIFPENSVNKYFYLSSYQYGILKFAIITIDPGNVLNESEDPNDGNLWQSNNVKWISK